MSRATSRATNAAPRLVTQPPRPREADLIAQWGAGAWRGWRLRAANGARYTVIYQGRPGGPAGPDFRDAVLRGLGGERVTGDIELHLSPAGWRAHGHATDPRYNGLALHITLMAGRGGSRPCGDTSTLASGRQVPLVVLAEQAPPGMALAPEAWPCAGFAATISATAQRALFHAAGRARFEERVALRAAEMRSQPPSTEAPPHWNADDAALFIALAEGLGYGRDRAALRACGERLAYGAAPDALLTTLARAGGLERRRLAGLLALFERWGASGPLAALVGALWTGAKRAGAAGAGRALVDALTVAERGAVSSGRARILACNVALPAVVAWARGQPGAEGAEALGALALAAMETLSGLPSNQITREMTRQLSLPRLPSGALAQQGLHHLWAHHCREKRCDGCPCACPAHAPDSPPTRAFSRR